MLQANPIKAPAGATKSRPTISALVGLICCLIVGLVALQAAGAMQMVEQSASESSRGVGGNSASLVLIENPELTARVLDNLLRSIVLSASGAEYPISNGAQKRGLDLGISRGFSGSQAGKHLMGLSAASFANGPGR